jgi:hypothetical protein
LASGSSGKSKIAKFDDAIFAQKQILRFDIPVHDFVRVQEVERSENLVRNVLNLFRVNAPTIGQLKFFKQSHLLVLKN